ncbi:hypothetical protein ABKW25_19385, partial [Enterobacter hormaechei]|uniref:hypothetical protein n=1 Tax=Enterobacter hormaechei TaxID=158836 RepID=UPI00292FDE78
FGFAENTDDLFIGKTLLHGDVLMWLMKTLLTSGCTNQRGAGQQYYIISGWLHRKDIHSIRMEKLRSHKRIKKAPKGALIQNGIPSS